jgi:uncharacterized membrane protein (DUF485 family)
MKNLTNLEAASYTGSGASIAASLTFTDIGVLVGIATALLTFALNALYMYRKDRREQRESDAVLAQLGSK